MPSSEAPAYRNLKTSSQKFTAISACANTIYRQAWGTAGVTTSPECNINFHFQDAVDQHPTEKSNQTQKSLKAN